MLKGYFQTRRDRRTLRRSELFHAAWYRARYLGDRPGLDPVRHYLAYGARLGHDPHPLFDARWYLSHNTDVRRAGTNPCAHFANSGLAEGRAPHPWGEATWHNESASPTTLIDFMREQLRRERVGAIEMLTPDFVAGWVIGGAAPHLEVEVEGAIFAVHGFEPRPDLSALAGRPVFSFLFQFDRRQAPGARVVARFPAGEALLGAPAVLREPASATEAGAGRGVVNIDRPGATITRRVAEIAGWIELPSAGASVDVSVDGVRHEVTFLPRADIVALRDRPTCVGFSLRTDAADAAARGRTVLELAVSVDGIEVARRSLALALEPVPHDTAPLALFMHVPKTAGVSLLSAIEELPDARALWLYDDSHRSIADHLSSLTPHAFDDLRLVGGHYRYGIHRAMARRTAYFTILREPQAYLKSLFFYCKYVRHNANLQGLDIYEALEAGVEPYLDNAFVRHFADVPCSRAVAASDLVTALRVMERDFSFVGFVERMDESVARISRILGLAIPVRRENATPPTAEAAALDPREFARRSARSVGYDEILVARAKAIWWTAAEHATRPRADAQVIDLSAGRTRRSTAA